MIKRLSAIEVFSDEQICALEQHVIHTPDQRPLFGEAREFPRYISLPRDLESVARGGLMGVRAVEVDLTTDEVVYHY